MYDQLFFFIYVRITCITLYSHPH